jgi:hypothetical protein
MELLILGGVVAAFVLYKVFFKKEKDSSSLGSGSGGVSSKYPNQDKK